MSNADNQKSKGPQTTGHVWDGDLQEYNNPVPMWWTWAFYGTIIFALIYWLLFPTWPVGKTFTKGMFNDITFTNDKGQEVTTHWNMRALFLKDEQTGEQALKQQAYLKKISESSYQEITNDPDKMAFVNSMAKVLFADNCGPCHGKGANGVIGLYPNLLDDDWLWGGTIKEISQTIHNGRKGYMPSFDGVFSEEKLESLAAYVLSLSGTEGGDAAKIAEGKHIFQGEEGGCYYCHTSKATGMKSQGSANLTDKVWTIANVPGAERYKDKLVAVEGVILKGVSREMPVWKHRLPEDKIKLLTVYIHQLGGGK
ncbi:MAG TPA: cytochrome-c oxidase, cbb3-type subunit III [Gammaproteobacteria bacterium]|nr:cytochrome-c oxidase, cbb3-type subunit III [Gammaproteobacteria bacterium]